MGEVPDAGVQLGMDEVLGEGAVHRGVELGPT